MAVIANSVFIRRSVEDVFDFIADMRNELKWNPDVQAMEKTTDGPIGAGTRYRAKWKQSGYIDVECVRYERPRQVVFDNGGPIAVTLTLTVEPEGDGARIQQRFDARPNGWFRLVFPIFVLVMRRAEKQVGRNVKRYLEQGVSSAEG